LKLTNTLTGALEDLTPRDGKVAIYVCGVTPYAESHIGHAMSAIVYDVLVRYLRWSGNSFGGLEVKHVSNYTDVDDKLIDRGHELGKDPLALANENIAQWEEEQRLLGLLGPDVRPRVTDYLERGIIQRLIERIVENGFAYATPAGDVYYRVRAKEDYGKLSHRDIEQLRSGTRFEPGEGKEFALDFALWKAQKPGEPAWPSPWGPGRAGWHIECSAMAQDTLGDPFEIHGGGLDLVFPHHENEIAQSEAAGQQFARIWMHNGMVLRDGEKMSKSIGNVVSVREALERWSPDAIRLYVLNSHYRTPNNLTDEAMSAAARGVERLARAAARVYSPAERPPGVALEAGERTQEFVAALDDDLNTPSALAALFGLAQSVNRAADDGLDFRPLQEELRELAGVLGLTLATPDESTLDLGALATAAAGFGVDVSAIGGEAAEVIEALIARRAEARKARDFATGDAIRDALAGLGVELKDSPTGTEWSVRG